MTYAQWPSLLILSMAPMAEADRTEDVAGGGKSAVSKWRSGQTQPSRERMDKLQELAGEKEGAPLAKPLAV